MSIKVLAEVLDNAPCTGGQLLFLIALADQAGDFDRCAWPGMRQLMRRTRSSRRSVYNYADALQGKGIIERIDPEVAETNVARFPRGRHGGHSTVVWRIKPMTEWGTLWDASGETDQVVDWGATSAPQGEPVDETWGATEPRSGVQPAALEPSTRTTREAEVGTTASQSSLRPSTRRRRTTGKEDDAFTDPVDNVFSKPAEADADVVDIDQMRREGRRRRGRNGGPDTAPGLAEYFYDKMLDYLGESGDVRIGYSAQPLERFFATTKRLGFSPVTCRGMVDEFFSDHKLLRNKKRKGSLWQLFISNADTYRQRALATREAVDATASIEEFGGAIPQEILDEIAAAGDR